MISVFGIVMTIFLQHHRAFITNVLLYLRAKNKKETVRNVLIIKYYQWTATIMVSIRKKDESF
jgi:hypothetical protein